jgi:hypothetical protein
LAAARDLRVTIGQAAPASRTMVTVGSTSIFVLGLHASSFNSTDFTFQSVPTQE